MSTIYNVDVLADRNQDNNFKNREVKAFEMKYPEVRVIQDNYNSERELEDDWQMYMEAPYHLKVLSNELCLRLYGLKNEQQYLKIKSKFMNQDIRNSSILKNTYRPIREDADTELLNKMARDYMKNGGYNILQLGYDSVEDLNDDYYDFNNQNYDLKVMANNKSLEIYGKTVPEIYQDEMQKFLKQDITNSSLDTLLGKVDSLSTTEAITDVIEHTIDLTEAIMLLECAKKRANTPVEKTIVNRSNDYIHELIYGEQSLPLGITNFLLPWEIETIVEESELRNNPLFLNYYARTLGLKPTIETFQEDMRKALYEAKEPIDLIKLGWNPVLEVNEENRMKATNRANTILKEHLNSVFVNLTNTPNMLTESEYKQPFHKGISITIIQELNKDNRDKVKDTPKVMISVDYTKPEWMPMTFGQFHGTTPIDDIISQFKLPCVNSYFMFTSDPLYDAIKSRGIDAFNTDNELNRLCTALQTSSPDIGNKKLFINYLMNALSSAHLGLGYPMLSPLDSAKKIVSHIYSKLFGNYDGIQKAYSKLLVYDTNKIDLANRSIYDEDTKLILEEADMNADKDLVIFEDKYDNWQDFEELMNVEPNV